MLYEGTRDLNSDFLTLGFAGYQPVLDKIKATAMPKYLPIFNRVLTENGNTGYLVGNKLTLADVGLLEPILAIEELMGAKELEPYPAIQVFQLFDLLRINLLKLFIIKEILECHEG